MIAEMLQYVTLSYHYWLGIRYRTDKDELGFLDVDGSKD